MATKSLHSFCREHNLPKSSVHNHLKELGLNTSNGLDDEAQKVVAKQFGVALESAEPKAVQALVTVEEGNHRTVLGTPQIEEVFNLAQFRNVESISFDNPLALAEQFIEAADVLGAGMDADLQRQRQHLEATEQAKKQIEAKAHELSIKRYIYSDRANDLAARQTVSTADLQKALEDLQSLGKPNA